MSTTIYCELALYGADGRELDHPNYKRQTIPVDYKDGFDKTITWEGLAGATVSFWRLLIVEKMLAEGTPCPMAIGENHTVSVPLKIAGKGRELDKLEIRVKP